MRTLYFCRVVSSSIFLWNAARARAFSSNDGHSGPSSDTVGQTLITVSATMVLRLYVSARRMAIVKTSN